MLLYNGSYVSEGQEAKIKVFIVVLTLQVGDPTMLLRVLMHTMGFRQIPSDGLLMQQLSVQNWIIAICYYATPLRSTTRIIFVHHDLHGDTRKELYYRTIKLNAAPSERQTNE
jgi:hypothetical protein